MLHFVESLPPFERPASSVEEKIGAIVEERSQDNLEGCARLWGGTARSLHLRLYTSRLVNAIFGDGVYWIALTNPKDQWHETAIAARNDHPADELVTMEEVLV
jgi:hypothetical protein